LEKEMQEQQITLSDYIGVIYRGRWIIAVSFLVVMAATAYFTFTTQPVYEASAWVMYREEAGVQSQIFEVSNFIKRETMINNQKVILQSRRLAEEVVRKLQASPYADSLWILGNRSQDARFSLSGLLFSLLRRGKEKKGSAFSEIVDNFRKNVTSVMPQRDTDIIELKVQAYDPFEASFVANTWMETYQSLDISESRGEVGEIRAFLEKKVADVMDSLRESEQALKNFKETEKVASLDTETQQLIEKAAEFESLYQEARIDYESNLKKIESMRGQLTENQKKLVDEAVGGSSEFIKTLEQQRAKIAGEIAAEESQLKESGLYNNHNVNQKLQEKIDRLTGLQQKIISERRKMVAGAAAYDPMELNNVLVGNIMTLSAENDFLKEKSQALLKIVTQYRGELNKLPEKSLRLAELEREVSVNNNIYIMMREKFEENRIAEAGTIGQVRIIDYAQKPEDPIKPKKKMNLLLGLMLGLGLGVGIVFVREYLDTSLKTMEDVERMGFSVLGSIPLIIPESVARHVKNGGNGEIKRIQSRLITHFAPKSPVSEAYRTLRTNISYSLVDNPLKTAVVTSSGPGEGKSTTVANLAIAFAQMGSRVLLVDADLRRPVLHGIFGVQREPGLVNVVAGKSRIAEALADIGVENLTLLPAGTLPPNPSELLASQAMEELLKTLSQEYDIILCDSPPVIAVTDACVLARKLDGVILVAKSGETSADALSRAKMLLDNVNAHLFGISLNGVNINRMYGSYYYYYHHYYYGDEKEKGSKKGRRKDIGAGSGRNV